jgi:hypothetical protein
MTARRWRPAVDHVVLAGLTLWLFRAFLFGGGVVYKRDVHLVWQPQVEAFVRGVAGGAWPLWDPSPSFGQPLLADPSAQILYPPTWLNFLIKPWTYYSLYAAAHFALAALGLRALALRLGLSRPAALTAAAAFVLSGPFISMVDLWHHYAGAAWMPWVLWASDRAVEGGRRRVAAFAAMLALQILAGSADMCAMTLILAAVLAAARAPSLRALVSREHGARLLAAGGGALLGIGLAAGLWLSAFEIASRAARMDLPPEVRTYWSLHPLVSLEMLLPQLWSALPLAPALRARFFESREPFLASLYLGAGGLALVAAAASALGRPVARWLLATFVVALVAAMGPHTPLHGAIVTALPPLGILRYPVKITVLAALTWAILVGFGFDAFRAGVVRRPRLVLLAVLVLAAAALAVVGLLVLGADGARHTLLDPAVLLDAGAVRSRFLPKALVTLGLAAAAGALVLAASRGRTSSGTAGLGLAVLTVVDLAVYHRTPNPVAPRALYTHRPEVVSRIGGPADRRVYVYDYSVPGKARRHLQAEHAFSLERAPDGWTLDAASALGMQMYLFPPTAGRWSLSQAYDLDLRGLQASYFTRLARRLRDVEETPEHLRLLQLGGTTHAVSLHAHPDLSPPRPIAGLFKQPVLVQEVPAPLPRVFAVSRARRGDDARATGLLLDPGFDFRREIVIADPGGRDDAGPPGDGGRAHIQEERADRFVIAAELDAPGYVVLLDSYDEGWKARVDGRPAAVQRANLIFRAVEVAAGPHRIEMTYRPRGPVRGALLSLACAGVVAAMAAPRRGRAPSP